MGVYYTFIHFFIDSCFLLFWNHWNIIYWLILCKIKFRLSVHLMKMNFMIIFKNMSIIKIIIFNFFSFLPNNSYKNIFKSNLTNPKTPKTIFLNFHFQKLKQLLKVLFILIIQINFNLLSNIRFNFSSRSNFQNILHQLLNFNFSKILVFQNCQSIAFSKFLL